jgi:hypothetical protein
MVLGRQPLKHLTGAALHLEPLLLELTSIQVNDSARNCGVVEVGAGGYAVQQGGSFAGTTSASSPSWSTKVFCSKRDDSGSTPAPPRLEAFKRWWSTTAAASPPSGGPAGWR